MIIHVIILYICQIKKSQIGSIELLHIQNAHNTFAYILIIIV